jgi:hypothetical protein
MAGVGQGNRELDRRQRQITLDDEVGQRLPSPSSIVSNSATSVFQRVDRDDVKQEPRG